MTKLVRPSDLLKGGGAVVNLELLQQAAATALLIAATRSSDLEQMLRGSLKDALVGRGCKRFQ